MKIKAIVLTGCVFIFGCTVAPIPFVDPSVVKDDLFTPEENKVRLLCGIAPQFAVWIYTGEKCGADEKEWLEVANAGCQPSLKAKLLRTRCLSELFEECYKEERIYTCE